MKTQFFKQQNTKKNYISLVYFLQDKQYSRCTIFYITVPVQANNNIHLYKYKIFYQKKKDKN